MASVSVKTRAELNAMGYGALKRYAAEVGIEVKLGMNKVAIIRAITCKYSAAEDVEASDLEPSEEKKSGKGPTFTIGYDDAEKGFLSGYGLWMYVKSEDMGKLDEWWTSAHASAGTALDKMKVFLYKCAEGKVQKLKESSAEYSDTEMFAEDDSNWQYYVKEFLRVLPEGDGTLRRFLEDSVDYIGNYGLNAVGMAAELVALLKAGANEECRERMEEAITRGLFDVNAFWFTAMPFLGNDLTVFRTLHKRFGAVMRVYRMDTHSTDTPMTRAKELCVAPVVRYLETMATQRPAAVRLAEQSAAIDAMANCTLKRLAETCEELELPLDKVMQALSATLVKQVESDEPFSKELMQVTVKYEEETKESVLGRVMQKAETVLDYKTLYKSPVAWRMAEKMFVAPLPSLLRGDRLDAIEGICKKTISEYSGTLKADMRRLVAENQEAYKQLCALKSTPESQRPLWRHDVVFPELHKPLLDGEDLDLISLRSTSPDFNAKRDYDLFAYLYSLLCSAHTCNVVFCKEMERLTRTHSQLGCGEMHFGPVKDASRCRAKATEDSGKWPRTSALMDLVRCSLNFDSIGELLAAVKLFEGVCAQTADSAAFCEMKEVRTKNLFAKFDGVQVPESFCDLKKNVAVTATIDGKKRAIIAEIQFLLTPVLSSKKRGHEIYQTMRNLPLLREACVVRKRLDDGRTMVNQLWNVKLAAGFLTNFPMNDGGAVGHFLQRIALCDFKPSMFDWLLKQSRRKGITVQFEDDFVCQLAQRRADCLLKWLRKTQEACDAARFQQLVVAKDICGAVPLLRYLEASQSGGDAFDKALVSELLPDSADDTFWLTHAIDSQKRNAFHFCTRASMAAALSAVCGQRLTDRLLQQPDFEDNAPVLCYLYWLWRDAPRGVGFSEEVYDSLIPACAKLSVGELSSEAHTRFWTEAAVADDVRGGNVLHRCALVAPKHPLESEAMVRSLIAHCGEGIANALLRSVLGQGISPLLWYLMRCSAEVAAGSGFNVETMRALIPTDELDEAFWLQQSPGGATLLSMAIAADVKLKHETGGSVVAALRAAVNIEGVFETMRALVSD